ncbi:AB hydrolase-1 domain-containing protein [Balamuthia mandrillaris]
MEGLEGVVNVHGEKGERDEDLLAEAERRRGGEGVEEVQRGEVGESGSYLNVGAGRNDPVDLYYEVHGAGPQRALWVMGLGTSLRGWKKNIEYFLDNHYNEFQLCIFDNRGVGRSGSPKRRYTTKGMAYDALELLQHLGWDEVHVIGISMGGMISMELALLLLDHQQGTNKRPKLLSLSLAVTHAGGLSAIVPFAGFKTVFRNLFRSRPEDKVESIMRSIYSPAYLARPSPVDSSKTMLDYVCSEWLTRVAVDPPPTKEGAFGQIAAVNTHYVSAYRLSIIQNSGVPTLIMTGTNDSLVRPQNSFNLAKRLASPQLTFLVWEGVGHAVNSETFDEFNAAVLAVMRQGAQRSKTAAGGPSAAEEQEKARKGQEAKEDEEEEAKEEEEGKADEEELAD